MDSIRDLLTENSKFNTITESTKNDITERVIGKVLSLTIGKYSKVDMSEIEKSRGDITRIKFYKDTIECIETLKSINDVTHKIDTIEEIDVAVKNLVQLKNSFEKSFRIKNELSILLYNSIVYSIMVSLSYMISSAIAFVNDSEIAVSEVNSDIVLMSNIIRFNKLVKDGSIYKFISETDKEPMNESSIGKLTDLIKDNRGIISKVIAISAVSAVIIGLLSAIVPIIRNTAYFIYRTKHNISETAKVQATLLELNIKVLQEADGNTKIIARQTKWVNFFNKISEKFAIDADKSKKESEKDMKEDNVDLNSLII